MLERADPFVELVQVFEGLDCVRRVEAMDAIEKS